MILEFPALILYRPQFEDSAIAVIITKQDRVKKYETMVSGQELLESWYASLSRLFLELIVL